jgi:hypothetical protein
MIPSQAQLGSPLRRCRLVLDMAIAVKRKGMPKSTV